MKSDAEKIIELEIQLSHLQRQYDVLNGIVTEQAMLLDRMTLRLGKLESLAQRLKNSDEPMADPLDEKPPHY